MKLNQTILIVDDEEDVRGLMKEALEGHGYSVIDVSTGERAIEVCRSAGSIRLVITDLFLPSMNGTQLVGRLSILQPGIKSLLISGDIGCDRLAEGADFLGKPFSILDLTTRVKSLLGE